MRRSRRDCISMTREELYELVWKEPMRDIAPRLGMSDRGLTKLCGRFHIPCPPVGYWIQKDVSRKTRQPPLPEWQQPGYIRPQPIELPGPLKPGAESVVKQRAYESAASHRITVASVLTKPDPLVKHAARVLTNPDERGILRPSGRPCIDIGVTKGNLNCALRIFNAMLKAIKRRGWAVTVQTKEP